MGCLYSFCVKKEKLLVRGGSCQVNAHIVSEHGFWFGILISLPKLKTFILNKLT